MSSWSEAKVRGPRLQDSGPGIAGLLCSVLGRSGCKTGLTLTAIQQRWSRWPRGRMNVCSTRCSNRRTPARRSHAARATASPQLELNHTTRSRPSCHSTRPQQAACRTFHPGRQEPPRRTKHAQGPNHCGSYCAEAALSKTSHPWRIQHLDEPVGGLDERVR